MTSNFFNNTDGNTLFAKFRGIAEGMADFHTFQAVSGFFRSSGWFKLRKELELLVSYLIYSQLIRRYMVTLFVVTLIQI